MSSWVKARLKRKRIVAKIGGYTGKSEARTPLGDIMSANRMWLTKDQARNLKLRNGQSVTLNLGRLKVKGKVARWSRGAKQIVFDRKLALKRKFARKLYQKGYR